MAATAVVEVRGIHVAPLHGEWGLSDEGRRAKFYRLTAAGKKRVSTEQEEWRRFSLAVEQVLEGS